MKNSFIEEVLTTFDEQFGKRNPDTPKDDWSLSIDRGAGCDDCRTNQEVREEHKVFLSNALEGQMKIVIDLLPKDLFKETKSVDKVNEVVLRANELGAKFQRDLFLNNLKDRGLIE